MKIAITYSIVNGGASKGFLEFLKSRENIDEVNLISAEWAQSHHNFIKSKINALVSKVIQKLVLKRYVKCSLNIWPIIDLSKFSHSKVYLGWVGNGMINFKNNPKTEYIVRFSDEWWVNDFQHYKMNEKIVFPSILRKKLEFLNRKNVTIIFPSKWLKQNFIKAMCGIELQCRTELTRNVASPDFFITPKVNLKKLFFVASKLSDPNKGFHLLQKYTSSLQDQFDEIVVIGSTLNTKVNRNMNFLGVLNKEDLVDNFRSGGIYLHLAERDNSPNTLIEACSAGLIPIVLNGSGAQEYVETINFKVPLLVDSKRDLIEQIQMILECLKQCTNKELEYLVLHIQENIQKVCGANDSFND